MQTKNYLILFADLIGSTEVATEQTPPFFASNYIASFRWSAERAFNFLGKTVWSDSHLNFSKKISNFDIVGDEVTSFTPLDELVEEEQEDIVASAVLFAYLTKLYWFISPYNLGRLSGKQFPRDMAVGIHIGPASKFPLSKTVRDIAGLHINVAKRIETLARGGRSSRICASEDAATMFNNWCERFKDLDTEYQAPLLFTRFNKHTERYSVKGLPTSIRIHELDWNIGNRDAISLLNGLEKTPEIDELDAEKVLKLISAEFFSEFKCGEKIWSINNFIEYRIDGENLLSTQNYIKKWFEVVNQQPKLFLDQLFLATSYYIISCSLIRCPCICSNKQDKREFQEITKKFYRTVNRLHKEVEG